MAYFSFQSGHPGRVVPVFGRVFLQLDTVFSTCLQNSFQSQQFDMSENIVSSSRFWQKGMSVPSRASHSKQQENLGHASTILAELFSKLCVWTFRV